MNNTYPCIKVIDIETTIHWYVDFLQFQCTYKSSIKNPDFALIENKNQKIYLIQHESKKIYGTNAVIIETSNLKEEFKSLEKAGVIIVSPISKGAFPGNEFIIKDYEGNKLIYIQKT